MATPEQQVTAFFDAFFRSVDLKVELKKTFFDGYDTYEDYVKYGDLFEPVSAQRSERSSRALVRRPPA
jgi:hypothetical protein